MDADRGSLAPAGLDVCLQSRRGVAGLIHVIHNAANDLGSCMDHYDSTVEDMTALSSFLRSRDSKERLLAKCFWRGDASHSSIRSKIEHFDAECYRPPVSSAADLTFQASRATPQQHVNMVFFKLLPSMHRMKRFQIGGTTVYLLQTFPLP